MKRVVKILAGLAFVSGLVFLVLAYIEPYTFAISDYIGRQGKEN